MYFSVRSYKYAYLVVVLWKFSAVWNLKLLIHSYKYFYRTLLFFRTFCSVSHMSFQRKGTYNFLAPITNWLTHSINKLNSCMRCLLYKLMKDWIHIYIIMRITLIPDLIYLVPSSQFLHLPKEWVAALHCVEKDSKNVWGNVRTQESFYTCVL